MKARFNFRPTPVFIVKSSPPKIMYDIIGDIHGYAGPLKKLLEKPGYTEIDDTWHHSRSKMIFVGGYVDRHRPFVRHCKSLRVWPIMVMPLRSWVTMNITQWHTITKHRRVPSQTR